MNCTICNKPIILVPSAEERAKNDVTGRPATFYRNLFREHAECQLKKRHEDTLANLRTHRAATAHINPADVWKLSQARA